MAQQRKKTEIGPGETSTAKDDGTDGACSFRIGEGDIAAVGFFVDRHLRNERDAHSGADHSQKTRKLSALENDLRVDARTVAGGDSVFAEAVAIAQEEEWFFSDVFQGD